MTFNAILRSICAGRVAVCIPVWCQMPGPDGNRKNLWAGMKAPLRQSGCYSRKISRLSPAVSACEVALAGKQETRLWHVESSHRFFSFYQG